MSTSTSSRIPDSHGSSNAEYCNLKVNQPQTRTEEFEHEPNDASLAQISVDIEHKSRLSATTPLRNSRYTQRKLPPLCSGWKQHIHPDGKPYYRNASRKILTELDVSDVEEEKEMGQIYEELIARYNLAMVTQQEPGTLSDETEIYLTRNTTTREWEYYFVDYSTEDVFWVEKMDLRRLIGDRYPTDVNYHLCLLRNYYSHIENFPCHHTLPRDAEDNLRAALIFTCADHLTSGEDATSPWTPESAKCFLEMLDSFRDNTTTFKDQLYGSGYRSCFFSYQYYQRRLDDVWGSKIVSSLGWQRLVLALLKEWSDSNLLATVTLSANIAFLALPGIVNPPRFCSLLSTFLCLRSILSGLHHVWIHRFRAEAAPATASMYFQQAERFTGTLKPLALFLALPITSLLWGLCWFAAAVAAVAAQAVSWGMGGQLLGNVAGIGVAFLIVLVLMLMVYGFFFT
ncbi:hypothetical protein CPB83DRAFT_838559 [Crepidotus variabilis]|uniref:WW domain-containing protein n=1 Tax=Crepidotus variabilis TaxID=179855 RepID=A0A9P6E9F0_9AGAR|nr:hypothetical protein CPB83DRAFT_838559 [Crepidotus variabilis]